MVIEPLAYVCVFGGCRSLTAQFANIGAQLLPIFFLFILKGLGGSGSSNGHNSLSMKCSNRGSFPHFTNVQIVPVIMKSTWNLI